MLVRSGWREIAPDLDGNGIPDTVCMVEDGGEEQTVAFGGEVELGFVNLGVRIANLLVAEESFLNDAWIRIAAELVNDDNRDVKEAMLEKMPSLKDMYSADDDNTQVLYLKDATATICSFVTEPEVITF